MTYSALLLMLKEYGLKFTTCRSSYITEQFRENKTYIEREKIATAMRHSVGTAMLYYNKIKKIVYKNEDESDDEDEKIIIFDKFIKRTADMSELEPPEKNLLVMNIKENINDNTSCDIQQTTIYTDIVPEVVETKQFETN